MADVPIEQSGAHELDRVLRARYVLIVLAFGCSAILSGGRGDWDYFVDLGRSLLTEDRLGFYRIHGDAQTGALSLLAAAAFSVSWSNGFVLAVVLTGALGLTLVVVLERWPTFETEDLELYDRRMATLLSGTLLGVWWGQLGATGHLDDAAVLAAAVLALRSHLAGHTRTSGLIVGLSLGFKPWAVFFIPLTLDMRRAHREYLIPQPGLCSAIVLGLGAWLPFIIAEPSTLTRLRATVLVADDSALRLLGLEDLGPTAGLRIVQLVAGTALVLGFVMTRRAHASLAAAVAVRVLVDPGTWNYYSVGLVLGCVVWERVDRGSVVPRLALIASIGMLPESIVGSAELRAVLRVVAITIVLATILLRSRRVDPGRIERGPPAVPPFSAT